MEEKRLFILDQDLNDYIVFCKPYAFYLIDTISESSNGLNLIKQAIIQRKSEIYIAFYRRPEFHSIEQACIQTAQSGHTTAHAAVWFGQDVVELVSCSQNGIWLSPLPPCTLVCWEGIRLPFKDVLGALDVANEIIKVSQKAGVVYGYNALRVVEYIVAGMVRIKRILEGEWPEDYDFKDPTTWTNGVHCTQLVLLFLKQCVFAGCIEIEDKNKRKRFMERNSHTCMPYDLRLLLQETWGVSDPDFVKICTYNDYF